KMNSIINKTRSLLYSICVLMLAGCGSSDVPVPFTQPTYTVSVTVSGLNGSGLVLQNNAGDDLAVTSNGVKTFATSLRSGASYAVTILAAPSSPAQTCILTNASGTVAAFNIADITVACRNVAHAYTTNQNDNTVSVFNVDDTTGNLASIGPAA